MTRSIGSIVLDDNVNTYISEMLIPSVRELQLDRILNRQGRVTRVKEDWKPLVIDLRGFWIDGGGKYWRDFRAAMLGQSRAAFVLGDGTRYEMVDVQTCDGIPKASVGAGTPTPSQAWAYTAKVAAYEPVAREVAPSLNSLGALTTGNGSNATNFTIAYAGTAFAEPSWQFALVIPGGVTVTQLMLQNTATNEVVRVPNLSLTNGTWYVVLDASGGVGLSPVTTPNNNGYGLLTAPSVGYGCTVQQLGGAGVDTDFTGRVPTLIPSTAPTIPPSPNNNGIVATVTATGALTSAALAVLAPARFVR